MKTDIKQLLKELSARDLEFRDSVDQKLLNKEKEYHFHDNYMVANKTYEYSYPCLVEIEIEDSKVFNLKRKSEIQQNVIKVDKEAYLRGTSNVTVQLEPTQLSTPEQLPLQVTTTVAELENKPIIVSDEAAKAMIGEFLEKNQ